MKTHSVLHDYVDVVIEGPIDVLRSEQVEEITIVMVQVDLKVQRMCKGLSDR